MQNISGDTNLEFKRKKTTLKQEMGTLGTQAPKRLTIIAGSRGTLQATSSTSAPMSHTQLEGHYYQKVWTSFQLHTRNTQPKYYRTFYYLIEN